MGITATGRRRNHTWPEALKREIVAASFAPGSSVSMVARHYDVNANQVFSWRKRYRDDPRAAAGGSAPQLIPVTVTAETAAVATAPSTVTEMIEIDLAGKYRVRVGSGVDAQALRRVLDVLERRRGMNGLALQVQEALRRDPHAGDLYVFRGARGDLIKILWHDGLGMSLYAKRLEKGRFIWPSPTDGVVGISASQLAYMLDGIDWRNPRHTFRPERAG